MPVQVYKPSALLSDFISYYYSIDEFIGDASDLKKRLPDGGLELFFHYGDPFYKVDRRGEETFVKEKSLLLGQLKEFIQFKSTGHIGFIGVKFKPHTFQRFIGEAIHAFTDKIVSIEDLWGSSAKLLEEKLANENNNEERVRCIENFLYARLQDKENFLVDQCIKIISKHNGNIRVTELAKEVNISTRQLERKFLNVVGISPNSFSRIKKMQQTFISIERRDFASLTELCYEHGYYDQSHFIKEVDKFAGITPGNVQVIKDCFSKTAFL